MIIFSSEVLFIHNPKTAGTSLLRFLSEVLPGRLYLAGVNELGSHHPHLDAAVAHARNVSGFDLDRAGSKILSVLREPIDREKSMYRYYRDVLAVSPTLVTDLPDVAMQAAVRAAASMTLEEWLDWQRREFGHCDLWQSELFYRCGDGSYPKALSILRFENLATDLSKVIPEQERKSRVLPHLNVSDRRDGELLVSAQTEQFIRESYSWMHSLPDRAFLA